jgi:hypothetical protein
MTDLGDMPLQRRDKTIAQVWSFLAERGYTITAPSVTVSPLCVCEHEKYVHASAQPTWCLVKGGCDCHEFEVADAVWFPDA